MIVLARATSLWVIYLSRVIDGVTAGNLSLAQYAIVVAYAVFMLGVCFLACVVPTRRALSVPSSVNLRQSSWPGPHSASSAAGSSRTSTSPAR